MFDDMDKGELKAWLEVVAFIILLLIASLAIQTPIN